MLLAQGSGEGEPGSVYDPVLTRDSFNSFLKLLFEGKRRQIEQLEARFDRVERGILSVQECLKGTFPDLRGHWAEEAVIFLRQKGIISGYPDGTFHPDEQVSRAAFAVMLARAKNLASDQAGAKFIDVSPGYWASGEIGAAQAAGFLNGYPNGMFYPERKVTRAEMSVVINKAFAPRPSDRPVAFKDLKNHWAQKDIENLAAAGVLGGYPDGTFRPDKTVSRAEAAAVFAKVLRER